MEEEAPVLPLPDTFLDFLNESGIYPSVFTAAESTPHYIRLKPGLEEVVDEIGAELGCELSKVEWLREFYSLPLNVQIACSKAYREGKVLVDAECKHDGSVKHILKLEDWVGKLSNAVCGMQRELIT